ncbi:hypothetical protein C1645_839323 [Glomus cerebriforme]|uniref:F-box domain-containing protein n=1 Tax=Glomus cerebriforme TaxID=658196 RepID=A0A397S286_9GLOM|nr:hypothetical protein C1645_839323 [Glomus cerebriforme]
MSKLNRDVLYLIFKELHDIKSLYSCLLVNKTWCEIIIPIIWINPWKFLKPEKKKLFLNVIISHLSDESRKNLSQDIDFLMNSYQRPLFNYISFCKYLDFNHIFDLFTFNNRGFSIEKNKNEIFKLFINENTKFTYLYFPYYFNYQIHHIPGAKCCLSEIEFFSCNARINDNVLVGLAEICKSIKELELTIDKDNKNYGIIRFIEAQKKLYKISIFFGYTQIFNFDDSFYENIENSLIKHANTIQHFKITEQPMTNFLSFLVNLKTLELSNCSNSAKWNVLENLFLPYLQILRTMDIPIRALACLIKNSGTYLNEIVINNRCSLKHNDNKMIIQAIYQNCHNLKYLGISFLNNNILELDNLLINCQYLNGLYFTIVEYKFDWNKMFEILIKSSPVSLFKFKFKFQFYYMPDDIESFKTFFDNWKDRHPILLYIILDNPNTNTDYFDLLEEYKTKGIIKKYKHYSDGIFVKYKDYKDFEW